MIHKSFFCIAGLSILLAITGCDVPNENNDDGGSGNSEAATTYTVADVIGTWTHTNLAPGVVYESKIEFSSSDFTYTMIMNAQEESTQVWDVAGTWVLDNNIVTLSKETCLHFGGPGNCNDVDDNGELIDGKLQFQDGDFVKE